MIIISQSMTDWTKCFKCRKKTKEKLRSTDEGRKSLTSLLPKFSTKISNVFKQKGRITITLNNSNASYHHSFKNT